MPMTNTRPARHDIWTTHGADCAYDRAPGKFEGEPHYVRAFWRAALNGCADVDLYSGDTLVSAFILTAEDRAEHPALGDAYALALWEDADGFVHSCTLDQDAYETWLAECNADDTDATE